MKLNKMVVISVFILILFTMGAVSAADENITEAVDDVLSADSADEDEISASSGTFAGLQSLVDDAVHGETLYLDKDYSRTDNHKIRISKAITIDGQGHTINANNKPNFAFYVTNSGAVIKNLTFSPQCLRGFNEAIITAGGINTSEVNPKTMESKLIASLYFAGELLDLDALTGGFNLQIAFSTGYAAGMRCAQQYKNLTV